MAYRGYNNNPNLPRSDYIHSYTAWEGAEYKKCAVDPVYFAEKYIKIIDVDRGLVPFDMWDFQKNMMKTFSDNRFTICKLPRQVGKALPLDEDILTPSGWKKFGDLKLGDKVYGKDGKETPVTFITETMFDHKCYNLALDDGSVVKCDAEHLWEVATSDWSHKTKVMNTEEVLKCLHEKQANGSSVYIQINKAILYEQQDLPIDPYTLGVWLGDGNSRDGRITCHRDDLSNYVEFIPYGVETVREDLRNTNINRFNTPGLNRKLRLAGLKMNKHIPDIYKTSSIEQRVALIQGMMDTDGSIRKNGGLEFYNKNETLINDFIHILRTLGIKARKKPKLIDGETYYTVRFATGKYECFKLSRKLEKQKAHQYHEQNERLYIQSITPCESVPVRCIQVDNSDHMFLIGKGLIPTHNTTTTVAYILHYILFNENVKVAILANKAPTAREIMSRLQLAFEYLPAFLKQGIKEWNKSSIELANGSLAQADSTSGSSIRGRTYNIVFLDEFAHVPNNIAKAFFMSTYPTISSGQTTKIIIVSTPNGLNMFHRMWKEAVEKESMFIPIEVHWSNVPGRDQAWKELTIKNTSQEQFDQEFESSDASTTLNTSEGKISIGELYEKLRTVEEHQ